MMGSFTLLVIISFGCLFLPCCLGTSSQGILYPFPINTLLTCHVPNPAAGPHASMPEQRFRVPLQPGPTGTVWRPAISQFRVPSFESLDQRLLFEFLGADLNLFFTSIGPPTDNAVLAEGRLTVEGSGGADIVFMDDPTQPPPRLDELDTEEERNAVRRWINDNKFGDCVLEPEWIRLHESYYPPFFSGSKCGAPGMSCSFPEGQTCEPDVGPGRLAYVPMLRWDCCWSFIMGRWRWECGWRKVEAPIIVDCLCGCQPRQRTDFK